MFDEDGSGELDKQEFISALGCAGFEEEEAISMFEQVDNVGLGMVKVHPEPSALSLDQVDADGQGGVGIEEFEAW